jgi:hypothetical protein
LVLDQVMGRLEDVLGDDADVAAGQHNVVAFDRDAAMPVRRLEDDFGG